MNADWKKALGSISEMSRRGDDGASRQIAAGVSAGVCSSSNVRRARNGSGVKISSARFRGDPALERPRHGLTWQITSDIVYAASWAQCLSANGAPLGYAMFAYRDGAC